MINKNTESLTQRVSILEQRVKKLQNALTSIKTFNTVRKSQGKISINEFLKTKKLKNDVERALAIAYWLDYFEKVDSFNVSDIENIFRAARLSVPENINDKVNMNIKNGCMAEHKEKKEGKKAWYVTNTGAELVEKKLNK